METENKVTFGRVVSASVRVDNSSNKERQYGITAHADIQGGKVTNVHQGVVTDLETNAHIADFHSYGNPEQLNVTYQTSAGRGPILTAVEIKNNDKASTLTTSQEEGGGTSPLTATAAGWQPPNGSGAGKAAVAAR